MKKHSCLVLLLGSAEIAAAQTTSTRPPTFGAAPLLNARAQTVRQINIRAAVDASYDSNVYGVGDGLINTGAIRNRSKDDFSITPSLLLNILVPVGARQSVFARGQIGYDFYASNTQFNRERINLETGANLSLPLNCQSQVSGSYLRFRSNAGDVFVTTPAPIVDRSNTEERTSIGGQAQCGGIAGISPTFGYRHSEVRNTSPFFVFNDSNQDSFDGSIGFQRPSLGRIAIYGSYATSQFLNRNIFGIPDFFFPVRPPRDGVTSYSAGARFERAIGTRASGSISVGYSWVDPKSLSSRRFRGNSYSLDLYLQPSDRLSVTVLASRSADLSNTIFSTFAVTEVYSLNGTYRLSRKLSANFGTSYQTRDFGGPSASNDNTAFIEKDEFTRVYGGVLYDLNRRLRLNALVSQQRRQSDNARFNYNNTTVSVGASLSLSR